MIRIHDPFLEGSEFVAQNRGQELEHCVRTRLKRKGAQVRLEAISELSGCGILGGQTSVDANLACVLGRLDVSREILNPSTR